MDPRRDNSEPLPDEPNDGSATEDLVAFLDGELDPDGIEAVEAKIVVDPTVRAEADALKKTWDLLDYLPRPEPSPNFTERTMSRLEPIRQSGLASNPNGPAAAKSGSALLPPQPLTTTFLVTAPRSSRRRLAAAFVWLAIVAAAGLAGYFVRAQIGHWDQQELDAKILSDQRMLQNVQRYRHVDDLAFLQALDNPELFGEEPYVTSSEGPK